MRLIKSLAILVLTLIILSNLSGCAHECTDELSWRVSPLKKTISIDQSFKLNVDGTTCSGKEKVNLNWYFESENTEIAVVDSEGYVTGKSAGNTRIAVSVGKGTIGASWVDITVK